MALHSFGAALISVTYGRFLPPGCHANVEVEYEFLNMFDWKGNRTLWSVWRNVCEDVTCCMWSVSVCAFSASSIAAYYITIQVTPLWFSYADMRASRSTQYVWVHIPHVPLCGWSVVCVSVRILHKARPANLCKVRQRNRRFSRRGCPDMKACRNGDNRLWIDKWRPVN